MSVPPIGPATVLPSTASDALGAQPIKAAASTNHALRVIRPPPSEPDAITLPARGGKLQAQLRAGWSIVATVLQFGSSPARARSSGNDWYSAGAALTTPLEPVHAGSR